MIQVPRILSLVGFLSVATLTAQTVPQSSATPWWDNFLRILNFINGPCGLAIATRTVSIGGDATFCSTGQDGTMGLYYQRVGLLEEQQPRAIQDTQSLGLHTMTYFEAFGEATSFVVQVQRTPDGTFVKSARDPQLTQRFVNHWDWELFDGTGEVRWAGPHDYFGDEDFARPYTLTHARYGSPPVRYPDGSIASGYKGATNDPRMSRVYDACGSKDVNGNLHISYQFNDRVNDQGGPFQGLIPVGTKYSGLLYISKDSACPAWIDYARASALQAIDFGLDGMYSDNYSPWDSFESEPVKTAFGEWSVASFRDYMKTTFTKEELSQMEIGNADTFDVRDYVRRKALEWGGDPNNLADNIWSDLRWIDDPIWRAYKIHKRRTGTRALERYYEAVKEAGVAGGKPDFFVSGNDFTSENLGWTRGSLDMVNSELQNWSRMQGPLQMPPDNSLVAIYKRAREHGRSRFVSFWPHVPAEFIGKPNFAEMMNYRGLASHAILQPSVGVDVSQTAGTEATTSSFFHFIGSAKSYMAERKPFEEIGLYYSSSSELASMTLAGVANGVGVPHSISFLGWGTALTDLHQQWRAIPEWKLDSATLATLKLLIIPESQVFDPTGTALLQEWVVNGGRLIVTGFTGTRLGESGNFAITNPSSLAPITGSATGLSQVVTTLGRGQVLYLREDIGRPYYADVSQRGSRLHSIAGAIESVGFTSSVSTPKVASTVGVTIYDDPAAARRFVDINNVDYDAANDLLRPASPVQVEIACPSWLVGKNLRLQVLSPDEVQVALKETPDSIAVLEVTGLLRYASIVLEPDGSALSLSLVNQNGASFDSARPLAQNSIVTARGAHLATSTNVPSTDLPTTLAGTSVNIRDSKDVERPAQLLYVSESQINYILPPATAQGIATVTIDAGDGIKTSGAINVVSVSPGVMTLNEQSLAAASIIRLRNGTQLFEPVYLVSNGAVVPLPIDLEADNDQVFLSVYGTGLRFAKNVKAAINGEPIAVLGWSEKTLYPGLDQVNIGPLLKDLTGAGRAALELTADGQPANTTFLNFR